MGTLFKRKERGGKSGYWYAQYKDHTGKRIRFNTGCKDKANAQEIKKELRRLKSGYYSAESIKKREGQAAKKELLKLKQEWKNSSFLHLAKWTNYRLVRTNFPI